MIKLIAPKSCTYVLSQESKYLKIHKQIIFSISKTDWRRFRDFQPYIQVAHIAYNVLSALLSIYAVLCSKWS